MWRAVPRHILAGSRISLDAKRSEISLRSETPDGGPGENRVNWHRWIQALTTGVLVVGLAACNVTMRPTRPDQALTAGPHLPGVRFSSEQVEIRESGMPLSTSRSWDREVQIYTASQLNLLLSTDPLATATRTIVFFDSAPPPDFQFGSWREMTVELTSVLPGGVTVRSKPVTGFIDSSVEEFGIQCLGVAGSTLDVAASLAGLIYVFSLPSSEVACGLFAGALIGGLTLNLMQSAAGHWARLQQQTRWSNLYAQALEAHAEDIRQRWKLGKPHDALPPPEAQPPPNGDFAPVVPPAEVPRTPPPASQPPSTPQRDFDDLPPPPPLSEQGRLAPPKASSALERTAF